MPKVNEVPFRGALDNPPVTSVIDSSFRFSLACGIGKVVKNSAGAGIIRATEILLGLDGSLVGIGRLITLSLVGCNVVVGVSGGDGDQVLQGLLSLLFVSTCKLVAERFFGWGVARGQAVIIQISLGLILRLVGLLLTLNPVLPTA